MIALSALLAIVCAMLAISTLEGSPYGWELLVIGLYPIVPAALILGRSRYAEALLRVSGVVAVPLAPSVLLAILLRGERPVPGWAVGTVVLSTIAGVASIIAIAEGSRYLRAAGVEPAGVRAGDHRSSNVQIAGVPAAMAVEEPPATARATPPLRVRHVLSAYAVGAGAGLYANTVLVLGLLAVLAVAGSPMPARGVDSLDLAPIKAMASQP